MKNIKIVLCRGLIAMLVSCFSQMTTTNYYFGSVNGDDANNGISIGTPFKSLAKLQSLTLKDGDSILLESGAVFTEKLLPSCCGKESNSAVLDKYEGLEKSHIEGNGADTATVHILNSENPAIHDLEISNKSDAPKTSLLGLQAELDKFGESHSIVIDDLHMHDVCGGTVTEKGGGIRICTQSGRGNDNTLNRLIGVTIKNCYLKDCQRNEIKFRGCWGRRQQNPNLGIVIRKNVLGGVSGDGIILAGCDGRLIEYNVIRNRPKTPPESEACDGIWPWRSDNTFVQFNMVGDHRPAIDGYAYDSDWGCRDPIFQHNLSYSNDDGFTLVIGMSGWPEDWCVDGNIGTRIRYNANINDRLHNYLTNVSHKGVYFGPVMCFIGYTQNTLVENNLFYLFPKPEPRIDCTLSHFTKHDSSYGKGDTFKNNYTYAPKVIIAVKGEKAAGNRYSGGVYVGSLETPATGFTKQGGTFSKSLQYSTEGENWDILLDFLKGKTVPINGRELRVLDIIGAN